MGSSALYFVCRIDSRLCAIPVASVIETLRPLPLDPLPGAPDFVLGVSLIRGRPTPVLSGSRLLGAGVAPSARRLVALRSGNRSVALAVDETVGVREIADSAVADAPLFPSRAKGTAIAAVATLDRDLLIVLESARLVPDHVWTSIEDRSA